MADVASHKAQNLPKGPLDSASKKLKKVEPQPVQDTHTEVEDTAGSNIHTGGKPQAEESEYDNITHDDTQEEEEEDGTEDVIPAGSIDEDGNVVDEDGKIIGHVNGKTASAFPGSMVDQEGDILDHEGHVIGKASLDGLKDAAEDVTEKTESEAEKPELTAPFGVQDNGEVTNATGAVVGKLAEGTPQDLVGTSIKEIDSKGNMKTETGSTVGKADLQDHVLDKVEGAGSEVGSAVSGSQKKLHETTSDVAGSEKLDDKAPKLDEDAISVPEGSKVDKDEVSATEEPKLETGAESVAESKLGSDGKPIEEPNLEDEGKSFETPQLDAEGKPIEEPKLDAEGKPVEEPKLDAEGKPIEESELDTEGKPIEEPKLDAEGKPIEEPKLDAEGKPIEEPELEDESKSVEAPKLDAEGKPIEDEGKSFEQPQLDADGKPIEEPALDKDGSQLPDQPELPDLSILKGMKVNKLGKIVDQQGNPLGQLSEGDPKKLAGKKVDAEGKIWDDSGKIIGRAELLPETEREAEPSAPFEDFPNSVLDAKGNVIFESKIVGKLIEGDAKKLEGKKVDADGDVLDKNGNVLGKAERYQEEDAPEEVPEAEDLSQLEGKKVNKAGNVVDDQGKLFGKVSTGEISKLIGKKVGAEGKIYSESGKVIGTAELIPVDDREEPSNSPFEDFPDAIVDRHGNILFEGQIVGKLIDGDAKKLVGKKIDKDGEVVDRIGNVLGRAERWIEEDAPEAEKIDMSALAGKRVNKVGNLVDSHGSIYGRLVEGDPKKLAGRMSDKNGQIFDEGGNVVGRAELVPESEREGQKEGPFAGFEGATVTKDGKVQDMKGTIIGRLIEGDGKKLYGKQVDADGDVLDRNGNTLGKAERWEEEEKEKKHSPVAGRKVNREGNVVDENGDVIAKLTEGEITKCSGKEIDEDGDVYNSKNQVIGHVTLLEDIPPEPEKEPEPEPVAEPEPSETPEEAEARKQLEQDKKLASQMAYCIQGSLDKITPILKMITDAIETAERQPKEELDEQKLVDTVRPLLEQGGQILQEANGVIRGLDPDGRIAANAKHKTAAREATPEEYRLAEVLKELAGNVTQTIENAKKKIAGMPHAKKELNPLWGLLAEPLGQILAAVGLLLAGVLGLVGRLLSGLGLGGLLDNLLGGLGLKGILKGLGLGMVTESLTGRK